MGSGFMEVLPVKTTKYRRVMPLANTASGRSTLRRGNLGARVSPCSLVLFMDGRGAHGYSEGEMRHIAPKKQRLT